jgi:hypothetical protein
VGRGRLPNHPIKEIQMNVKTLSKLAMVAALSFGAHAFAADAAAPAAAAPATEAKAPAVKPAKAKTMTGTVVSSDAIANTLVVKNAKGEETFTVAPTAKITQGKKEVKIADVAKDGKVTVKYTEENGAKTASSVKVSAAAAKKDAKTATAAAPVAQ